jgi:hypothetical protein
MYRRLPSIKRQGWMEKRPKKKNIFHKQYGKSFNERHGMYRKNSATTDTKGIMKALDLILFGHLLFLPKFSKYPRNWNCCKQMLP